MTARVLLFSQRGFRPYLSRCCPYEFEDTIRAMDSVDLLAPGYRFQTSELIDRTLNWLGRRTPLVSRINPTVSQTAVTGHYDLFFMVCQFATDLLALNALPGWRQRCAVAVCWLEEIWLRDLNRLQSQLHLLQQFDYIFINCAHSVARLAEITGRPCRYEPPGVDCLRFYPGTPAPARTIDVYNMGRRHLDTHQALRQLAEQGRIFYLYDTFKGNVPVLDPAEHRVLLASLIKRSRYFLANRAKVDESGETGEQQEVGFRFFEGAAGGAVMIGDPPRTEAFQTHFDWPDAVVYLPFGGSDIGSLMAELDRQPERLARIRHDNVVNALRRHDWLYRWQSVLASAGLEPTPAMQERQARLAALAACFSEACDGAR